MGSDDSDRSHHRGPQTLLRQIENIPTWDVGAVPVIDVPAILARRPHACLIDGVADDNPPGSLGGTPLDRLIRDAQGIEFRVFPQ